MTSETYKNALEAAKKELVTVTAQHEQTAKRIAQLRQTITTLERLMGRPPSLINTTMSLVEACEMAVVASDAPLTPVAVKQMLQGTGFDFSRYTNPMATIHSALKRLEKGGVIERTKEGYRVKSTIAELTEEDMPF